MPRESEAMRRREAKKDRDGRHLEFLASAAILKKRRHGRRQRPMAMTSQKAAMTSRQAVSHLLDDDGDEVTTSECGKQCICGSAGHRLEPHFAEEKKR